MTNKKHYVVLETLAMWSCEVFVYERCGLVGEDLKCAAESLYLQSRERKTK